MLTPTYIPAFETQRDDQAPAPWTNCAAASAAMLADLHTYGQVDISDVEIRRASPVPLTEGMTLKQLGQALATLRPELGTFLYSLQEGGGNRSMTWAQLREHLATGGGAVANGDYPNLAGHKALDGLNVNRWQPGFTGSHSVFVCDYRAGPLGDGSVLWMDPLGHGDYTGDRIPIQTLWEFLWKSGNSETARVTVGHGFTAPRPKPGLFVDVPASHSFADDIEKVHIENLMSGVGNSRFAPDRAVTRGELAAVIARLLAREE